MVSRPPGLRRRAALGLGAAGVLARPRRARAAARSVSFTLPGAPDGASMIAYIAKANGYWAEAGLDVTIARGVGPVATAQAIGAGQFDFGLSTACAGLQQAAKRLPLIQIASCSYDMMMAIAVPADSPMRTPKDLEGHSMVFTPSSEEYPFLPAFAAAARFDLARVKQIAADPATRNSLFVQRKADSVSGRASAMIPVFATGHTPVRTMLFSRFGLSCYGNTLMTQPARLTSDPATVRGIATGLMQAARFVLLQPADALKIFVNAVPEIALAQNGAEQARLGIGLFQVAMLDETVKGRSLGTMDPKAFGTMGDLVMHTLAATGDRLPFRRMTNDFLGAVTLTPDEWTKASAAAAEFKALLA